MCPQAAVGTNAAMQPRQQIADILLSAQKAVVAYRGMGNTVLSDKNGEALCGALKVSEVYAQQAGVSTNAGKLVSGIALKEPISFGKHFLQSYRS